MIIVTTTIQNKQKIEAEPAYNKQTQNRGSFRFNQVLHINIFTIDSTVQSVHRSFIDSLETFPFNKWQREQS